MPNVAEAKAEYARIQELLKRSFEEIFEDDASRRILRDAARNLSHAAETPGDSMHRIGNSVRNTSSPPLDRVFSGSIWTC